MAKRIIKMTVDVPSSFGIVELKRYLTEAVEASGGCRPPDDHLFYGAKVLRISIFNPMEAA